jgi:hypothetical protein
VFADFIRVQRGVDTAIGDERPAFAREASQVVATECVAGVNADPDDVTGRDRLQIERVNRLVDDQGCTVVFRCRRGQYVKPSRRNHSCTEGQITRVDQVYAQFKALRKSWRSACQAG